jgi:hypothetical protein
MRLWESLRLFSCLMRYATRDHDLGIAGNDSFIHFDPFLPERILQTSALIVSLIMDGNTMSRLSVNRSRHLPEIS